MSDFPHWNAAEKFSGEEIAALVVGVDPLDPQAPLWKAKPVLERIREGYRIGRSFVSHTMTKERFASHRAAWKEGLVSVLVSYFPIMQQEAWPGDKDRPFVFPRRVAGPEGEFKVQRFDRAEIHRWLSAIGMKSIYQFDPKQPDTTPAQPSPVVAVGAPETKEERQDRRLNACIEAGLPMDTKAALLRLPDGVCNVAYREGVTRQTFSLDVKAALKRRESAIREGETGRRA